MRDFTWRVSDCEELSGGLLTGDDGVGFNYYINLLSKQNLMKTVWISPRGLMDQ